MIFRVVVFETALLDDGIKIGADVAQRIERAAAVRRLQRECAFHVVMLRPAQPAALVGAGGADEHAIHIEENAANGNCVSGHLSD